LGPDLKFEARLKILRPDSILGARFKIWGQTLNFEARFNIWARFKIWGQIQNLGPDSKF